MLSSRSLSKISYGSFNIVGKADEDRHCLYVSSESTEPYAFGVFDGHGGSFGSELLSKTLFDRIFNGIKAKIEEVQKCAPHVKIDYDIYDAILCESVRKVTKSMSREIKVRSITGSTSVHIIVKPLKDGSFRVYCSNTGDSRCVVHSRYGNKKLYQITQLSEDHSLTLSREVIRIQEHKKLEWFPLPAHVYYNMERAIFNLYYPSDDRLTRAQTLIHSLKRMDKESISKVLEQMSYEDYSITRLSSGVLHDEDIMMNIETDIDSLDATVHYAEVTKSNNTNSEHTSISTSSTSGFQGKFDGDSDTEKEIEDSEFISAPLIHQVSFIGKRTTKDSSNVGPSALFSRHNISITMTRSIGDRHAARSCVCTPEITSMNVDPDEYARFILASDGFWDVVTTEKSALLVKNIIDPKEAACILATKARQLRELRKLRMDDITCVVVDINPHNNPILQNSTLGMPGGCNCTIS